MNGSFSFEVDKPDAPEGPLQYSDVMANSIKLAWKPPLENNGGEISGYVVEKCPVGSNVWERVPGFCPGEKMTVKGLEEGKKYLFRVKAENMYGVSEPLIGGSVTAENPFGAYFIRSFLSFGQSFFPFSKR